MILQQKIYNQPFSQDTVVSQHQVSPRSVGSKFRTTVVDELINPGLEGVDILPYR